MLIKCEFLVKALSLQMQLLQTRQIFNVFQTTDFIVGQIEFPQIHQRIKIIHFLDSVPLQVQVGQLRQITQIRDLSDAVVVDVKHFYVLVRRHIALKIQVEEAG